MTLLLKIAVAKVSTVSYTGSFSPVSPGRCGGSQVTPANIAGHVTEEEFWAEGTLVSYNGQ